MMLMTDILLMSLLTIHSWICLLHWPVEYFNQASALRSYI